MISVSIFYAFHSIQSQPALQELDATKQLFSDQLEIMLSVLSVVVAMVLGFLILYANQFLIKRRKKELGIYTLLGMEKGKIAGIFAGETVCVGFISFVCGIILGLLLSQGISLFSLRLFAVEISKFQIIFSVSALNKTIAFFALIFLIVLIFNVRTISNVKLIDLLTANRKSDTLVCKKKTFSILMLILSGISIVISGIMVQKYGIMPSHENNFFVISVIFWLIGTVGFFYSIGTVLFCVAQSKQAFYLKGLNAFFTRQIGSKFRTDFWILSIVCVLLTIAMSVITVGMSSAITMNEASKAALPFDLNVLAHFDISGETDIVEYLKSKNVNMDEYARETQQINLYEADMTYGDMFAGQNIALWPIDQEIANFGVTVLSITDFNRSMVMQGKQPYSLSDNEFLLNSNYKGTRQYVDTFLKNNKQITLGSFTLNRASDEVMSETYWMTSVGNNDRGTFIVPDHVAKTFRKIENILLVLYKESTNPDEVLQKMIPIGVEWKTEGYEYTEKTMLNGLYYGTGALMVFLCCYLGVVFLLICAALLSLKQLTETADNIYRYGLLQKLGTDGQMLYQVLFKQIALFFIAPLVLASIYSAFTIRKMTEIVEDFMNMHISAHVGITVLLVMIVYGSYFLSTYLACKRMVQEK